MMQVRLMRRGEWRYRFERVGAQLARWAHKILVAHVRFVDLLVGLITLAVVGVLVVRILYLPPPAADTSRDEIVALNTELLDKVVELIEARNRAREVGLVFPPGTPGL